MRTDINMRWDDESALAGKEGNYYAWREYLKFLIFKKVIKVIKLRYKFEGRGQLYQKVLLATQGQTGSVEVTLQI